MSLMLKHIQLLSAYNTRFNRQVYDTAALLTDAQYGEDRGAFFKSVSGTLNHILVGDILWFRRFYQNFKPYPALAPVMDLPLPAALDDVLYEDLPALRAARENMDSAISRWALQDLGADDLQEDLTYANTKGVVSSRNFAEVIMHVFNHHTHHRGQATTLLLQFGHDVGVTDFLVDIPASSP